MPRRVSIVSCFVSFEWLRVNYRSILMTAQLHNDEWYVGGDGSLGVIGGGRQPVVEAGVPRPLAGTSLDDEGYSQFDIEETPIETADGSYEVSLAVSFAPPSHAFKECAGGSSDEPCSSFNLSGASRAGGATTTQSAPWGMTARRVRCRSWRAPRCPPETDTNKVTLHDLSFAPEYRVVQRLSRAQSDTTTTDRKRRADRENWEDVGAEEELAAPPDANYHHANFYWRLELLPETGVDYAFGNHDR